MTMRDFPKDHAQFDPEAIESMSKALAGVLSALELKDRPDDRIVVAAKKIIAIARTGERDPKRLQAGALARLRH